MAIRLIPKRLVGQTIRGIRNRLGQTQAQFAETVGVSDEDVIASWEEGRSQPEAGTLAKIAAMGLADVLVFHDDTPADERPQLTPGEASELRAILARMEALLGEARAIVEVAAERTVVEVLEAASGRAPAASLEADGELTLAAEVTVKPRGRLGAGGTSSGGSKSGGSRSSGSGTSKSSTRSGGSKSSSSGGSSRSSSSKSGSGSSGGSGSSSRSSSGGGSGSGSSGGSTRSGSGSRSSSADTGSSSGSKSGGSKSGGSSSGSKSGGSSSGSKSGGSSSGTKSSGSKSGGSSSGSKSGGSKSGGSGSSS